MVKNNQTSKFALLVHIPTLSPLTDKLLQSRWDWGKTKKNARTVKQTPQGHIACTFKMQSTIKFDLFYKDTLKGSIKKHAIRSWITCSALIFSLTHEPLWLIHHVSANSLCWSVETKWFCNKKKCSYLTRTFSETCCNTLFLSFFVSRLTLTPRRWQMEHAVYPATHWTISHCTFLSVTCLFMPFVCKWIYKKKSAALFCT